MNDAFIHFHRPSIGEEEISEVVETLRSGWLTSGPRVARFDAVHGLVRPLGVVIPLHLAIRRRIRAHMAVDGS